MKYIIIIFLSVFALKTQAQQGEVRFFILPSAEYQILVDDKDLYNTNEFMLPVGKHSIKIFSPGHDMFDTTINIIKHEQVLVVKQLYRSDDFLHFLRDDQNYERQIMWCKVPSTVLTASALIFTSIKGIQTKRSFDVLENLASSYHEAESPSEISRIKDELLVEKNTFSKHQRVFRQSLVVSGISIGVTSFLWYKANKMIPPVFHDKVKIQFDSYISEDNQKIMNRIGLTYAF